MGFRKATSCQDTPFFPSEPISLPLLPLRDGGVPHMVIPAVRGVKVDQGFGSCDGGWRQIMLVAKKAAGKVPEPEDMFESGCVSSILQMLKLPDGTVKVLVEGVQRANTTSIDDGGELFTAEVVPVQPGRSSGSPLKWKRCAVPVTAAVRPVRQTQQENPA